MNRSMTTPLIVIQRAMNAVSEAFGSGWSANTFSEPALRFAVRGLSIIAVGVYLSRRVRS